jgi:hypothetical protein
MGFVVEIQKNNYSCNKDDFIELCKLPIGQKCLFLANNLEKLAVEIVIEIRMKLMLNIDHRYIKFELKNIDVLISW